MHKILFYNKFIICLYMFRVLCVHHQEVSIVLYSISYHFTLWMNFLHVHTICITNLYDCVISYTLRILYVLYAFVCS